MYKKMTFLAACAAALMMTSCEKTTNDAPQPIPPGGKGKFLVETTVLNQDGASGSTYIQLTPELSGTVTNAHGIQVDFASSVSVVGNDVFTFPTFGKDAINEIRKYTYDPSSQTLKATGKLPVPPLSGPNSVVAINSEKAYVSMYILGKIWIINPKTMQKTGEIDLSPYAHGDASPEPSYGLLRDGLYYLTLNQIDAGFMPYQDYRQIDVAVINTQTDKVEKVASEKVSQLSFPTRPMLKNMIFTDEQNDIYIACTGYFGYNPMYPQNGFVCIPSGKTDFDVSKSWDISGVDIQGTQHTVKDEQGKEKTVYYRSSSVYNCVYLGNGKLAAYAAIAELNGNNPYIAKNGMPVVIDLKAKTIKKIEGIPVSGGHGIFIDKYKNLVVYGSDGADKIGFFTYNPATEEVNHVITTKGSPYFFHAFD